MKKQKIRIDISNVFLFIILFNVAGSIIEKLGSVSTTGNIFIVLVCATLWLLASCGKITITKTMDD